MKIQHRDPTTMLRPSILRRPLRPVYFSQPARPLIRRASTKPGPNSRLSRLESRLPRFLSRIVIPLRNAPVSHITSFLLLHEITAIVPLFGLAAAFHYGNYLPPFLAEGKWVKEYTEKFGKYARKKGWLKEKTKKDKWFGHGETGVKIVVEFATAWAVVKALMPLRLVLSVWLTPWFARLTVVPIMGWFGRLFSKGGKGIPATTRAGTSPAAGTGAVGGGVLPKDVGGSVK